jgi:hypothetical protein
MLIMPNVFRDGNTSIFQNLDNNQPAGLNVYSHNIHYSPYETQIVN